MTTISPNGLFDLFAQRMDYLKQRQGVISQNVANADTAGYGARDLVSFNDALKGVGVHPVEIAQTNAAHISSAGRRIGGNYGDDRKAVSYETLPSGNSVVLEEQMMKVAQISNDYALVSNLYRDASSMIKMALGKSGTA